MQSDPSLLILFIQFLCLGSITIFNEIRINFSNNDSLSPGDCIRLTQRNPHLFYSQPSLSIYISIYVYAYTCTSQFMSEVTTVYTSVQQTNQTCYRDDEAFHRRKHQSSNYINFCPSHCMYVHMIDKNITSYFLFC